MISNLQSIDLESLGKEDRSSGMLFLLFCILVNFQLCQGINSPTNYVLICWKPEAEF